MMDLNNISPKKYGLKAEDYFKIYNMFKDKLTHVDIAKEFNMPRHRVSIVVCQIVAYISAKKYKNEALKAVEKVKHEAMCSYKDLLFPIDNEATIGTSKVIKGRIYSDGKLWQ